MKFRRNEPINFNGELHRKYLRAIENDLNTPATIVDGKMYRIVGGKKFTEEEFKRANPIPVVHSFLFSKEQIDGRLSFLKPY